MSSASYPTITESKKGIQLDPRTKLLLLLTITTLMFSTSNEGIMNLIKPLLSLVPFILILSERRFQTAAKYLILYAACFALERVALIWASGLPSFVLLAVTSIMTRFAPGIMMGAYLIASTSVSEFIGAMERMHLTEKIVIPLSVIFRFFPTVSEEYQAIRDAMKMRGIRFGGKNPFLMVEYRLVPLIVSVVKIGDELSAAALTRGLGAPGRRTNLCRIGFHVQDLMAALFCAACFALFLLQPQIAFGEVSEDDSVDHVTFSYGEETEHTGGIRDIELQIKRGGLPCSAAKRLRQPDPRQRPDPPLRREMSGGVWVKGLKCKQPLLSAKSWGVFKPRWFSM
ncbi:MAG: energy-coupling factor transporter transmembrane component T [Flavonifractor plautii]